MLHGERAVPDSIQIARYVDANFEGPALLPADPKVEHWISALLDIPIRELSYGGKKAAMGARVNAWRLRVLRKRREKYPEMAAVYDAKIEDISGFRGKALDDAHVDELRARVAGFLDQMESALGSHTWLAGNDYTMADVLWTVAVARFFMLELDPLAGRPHLTEWYVRVKSRPSFEEADIWEAMQFAKLAPVVARKVLPDAMPYFLGALVILGGLWILFSGRSDSR
jgi:glutathione S-transferase